MMKGEAMKILITGFDPFNGESVNPALEAVKLMKEEIAGAKIAPAILFYVFLISYGLYQSVFIVFSLIHYAHVARKRIVE